MEKMEEQDVEIVKSTAKTEVVKQKMEAAKNSQKESTAPWTKATSWQRLLFLFGFSSLPTTTILYKAATFHPI